jgi:hypothetical protein
MRVWGTLNMPISCFAALVKPPGTGELPMRLAPDRPEERVETPAQPAANADVPALRQREVLANLVCP